MNDISNSTILEHNIRLKYPADLPVVDLGSAKRPVWVPAELCDIIAGQPLGKLSDRETAQMIRYACNPPRVNAETIVNKGFPTLGLNPVASPIDGFDISIDPEMAVIPARELPPPRLSYKVGKANVNNGSWNILDVKFHRGAVVTNWWVLVVRDGFGKIEGPGDPKLRALVEGFNAKCKKSGISMPDGRPRLLPVALPPTHSDPTRANAVDSIRTTLKNELREKGSNKPSFVLVLLENRDNYIYPGLKVNLVYPVMNGF
jgi:eukaryotic translation initiation factor 2C